jgi:hypothetical protein
MNVTFLGEVTELLQYTEKQFFSAMPPTRSTTWDFGRLFNTLDYFGEVPILSWFQAMFAPRSPLSPPKITDGLIFDFTQPNADVAAVWGALDDVVMGGVSASSLTLTPEGALFAGEVSTENSGGFVSVRSRNFSPPLDLTQALPTVTGISLQVKGDGQRYKFFLRDADGWDSLAYAASFDTRAQDWLTVQIPFAQMQAVFRAKSVKAARSLQPSSIYSLQLMLSKFEYDGELNPHFQAGQFHLYIRSIGIY